MDQRDKQALDAYLTAEPDFSGPYTVEKHNIKITKDEAEIHYFCSKHDYNTEVKLTKTHLINLLFGRNTILAHDDDTGILISME